MCFKQPKPPKTPIAPAAPPPTSNEQVQTPQVDEGFSNTSEVKKKGRNSLRVDAGSGLNIPS